MPVAKSVGKAVFGDVIGGIAYAPIFWYSRGTVDAAKYCLNLVRRRFLELGVGVWIRNIFVPMFGQRDLAGILISFFMRLLQIVVRSIAFALWAVFAVALFVLYLAGPAVIAIEFLRQLFGVFGL
jgi:hypothetical protein